MLKYLTKKKNTFWYRRRINKSKEIVFSLKTKNYDEAVLRHSYINFEINYLFAQGIETMTDEEIRAIVDKYKNYMIEKSVNKFSRQRDEELSTYINGNFYGGHTKEALQIAIDKYQKIHMSNDYDLVKAVTNKILNRSNIKEEFEKLTDEDDIYAFHFELLKAEWDLLYKAKTFQDTLPSNNDISKEEIVVTSNPTKKDKYKISELLEIYINEKAKAEDWSDDNIKSIKYVNSNLISWFNDCFADELTRQDFVDFRDKVIQNLPQRITANIYKDKSLKEILTIREEKKKDKVTIGGINIHIGRVNQLFNWAATSGYIPMNYASKLQLKDRRRTKNKRKIKTIYDEKDLITLFNKSPWFTTELKNNLRQYPHYIFIPLISLYNGGAKPTEIAQLHISDIKKEKDVWTIEINDEEDKKLKDNYYNCRKLPIAQKLIDIGFLDYYKHMKKKGYIKLFPTAKFYSSGGLDFINKFSSYNRKYITNDEKKTLYSIKHLVNQTLKNNKVDIYTINDITGHSSGSNNKDIDTYGDSQMPVDEMKKVIDKCLTFDYIDLSHIEKGIKEIY